jgi:DNA-directed RNA polymerase specialized sigma24 family protein
VKAELPAGARRAVEYSRRTRAKAEAEAAKAADATREAVDQLTALGLSTRDAGELLGLSRQRVHQVLKEAS